MTKVIVQGQAYSHTCMLLGKGWHKCITNKRILANSDVTGDRQFLHLVNGSSVSLCVCLSVFLSVIPSSLQTKCNI